MQTQRNATKNKLRKSISDYLRLKGFSVVKGIIRLEGSEISSFNRLSGKHLIDCIDLELESSDEDAISGFICNCNVSIGVALTSLVYGAKRDVRESDSDVSTMLRMEMGTDELGWKLTESNYASVLSDITHGIEKVGIPWFSRFTSLPEVLRSLDSKYLTDFETRRKSGTARFENESRGVLSFLESEFTPSRLAILLRRYFKSIKEQELAQEIEAWEHSIYDQYPKKVSNIKDRPTD